MRSNPVLKALLNTRGSNAKLGPDVYSWSLPPGTTCPGKSKVCREICYARALAKRRPGVATAWNTCLRLSERSDFSDLLSEALIALRHREMTRNPGCRWVILRLHVSGDFYSPIYMQAWMKALGYVNVGDPVVPIIPWTYTRIWRVPWLSTAMQICSSFIRTTWPRWLWCSSDPDTGAPPPWVNEARMIPYPSDQPRAEWKRVNSQNPSTCPHLSAQLRGDSSAPTCQECGRCWNPAHTAPRRLGIGRLIQFPQHR